MTLKLGEKIALQKALRRKRVIIGVVILFILAILAATASFFLFGGHLEKPRKFFSRGAETEHFIDLPNKLNILVMGVDERPKEDDPGRSDTMFVLTIDTEAREVAVLSVPRDTRLRIKGLGWDKVNHAFSYGGVALSRLTAENFLGIPIDYYAKVDLEGFGRIVDAVGGVTVDVEERMQYEDTWDHYVIDLKPGVQRLDGRTALQYVRYRDDEGDLGRVVRQQHFVKALMEEVNTPAILLKAPSILSVIGGSLDTDMPFTMMLGLANKLKDGLKSGLKTHTIPGLPYYIDDVSYWVPDVIKTRQIVAEIQGVPFSGKFQQAAQRAADEYRSSMPANARLDDGTPSPGMDSTKKKPQVKAPEKIVKPPATTPGKPGPTTSGTPGGPRYAVEIVNASGIADAGGKISSIMTSRGFEVTSVSTASPPVRNTIVTSYTQNGSMLAKLSGLPFKYVLNVAEDSSNKIPVRIVVGQDYGGR